MTSGPDLLAGEPAALVATPAARLRRTVAATLLVVAAAVGAVPVLAVAGAPGAGSLGTAAPDRIPAVATPAGTASRPGAAPSALVAHLLAVPWDLLELSLRPDGHATAVLSARFEAPPGRPARPDELVGAIAHPALTAIEPVALVATGRGTAVDVVARLRVATWRRRGAAVPAAALPGRLAETARDADASIRGIRTVALEGGGDAAVLALDADADGVVAVLAGLEDGVSAPARMTGLLLRRTGEGLALDVTLTPRTGPIAP